MQELSTKDIAYEAAFDFAEKHKQAHGRLPIIIGVEIYEYFGQWVTIIEACESGYVVAEGRFGERKEVEFNELRMKARRK